MRKNTPHNLDRQGKKSQRRIVFDFLKTHTATASMVEEATGVKQKNICRIKRYFEKRGLLYEVERRLCQLTGFRASYLSTNNELFQSKKSK
jgi:predicted transcriptional regulator of viral defense system